MTFLFLSQHKKKNILVGETQEEMDERKESIVEKPL